MAGRRLGWDRNPMRRATDRIQALLRAVLLASLVIGGPIATTYAGYAAYVSAVRSGQAQTAAWHRVPSLILHVKPIATLRQSPVAIGPATLSVRWTTPQGPPRTGEIRPASGSDVQDRLSLSDRHVPLRTGGNDAHGMGFSSGRDWRAGTVADPPLMVVM